PGLHALSLHDALPILAVQPKRAHSPERRGSTVLRMFPFRCRYPDLIRPRHHGTDPDPPLRIAVLAPIAWRTPPRHYGPWEQFASDRKSTRLNSSHVKI